MRDNTGKPLGVPKTQHCGPDAGGFCTSYSTDLTGQYAVHGTDVGNGYARGPGDKTWRRLFTLDTVPQLESYWNGMPDGYTSSDGCYAIGVCASDGTQGFTVFRAMLWRLTAGLKTVTRVGTGFYKANANEQSAERWMNDKLAVDPFNPGVVVFTTDGMGAYHYIAGTTAAPVKIAGPNDDGDFPFLIAADRSAGQLGGMARRWLIYTHSQGLWESTDGPDGPYTRIAGSVTTEKSHMVLGSDGAVYLTGSNKIDKYLSGAWTVEMATGSPQTMAISGEGKKFAMDWNGNCWWTEPAGFWHADTYGPAYPYGTKEIPNGFRYIAEDTACRWLRGDMARVFPAKITADPVAPSKFHIVHGTGICSVTLPLARSLYDKQYGPVTFVDESAGNAMLVTMKAVTQPGSNRVLRTAWDKPFWISTNEAEANDPLSYQPSWIGVEIGSDIDWVPGNEDHLIGLVNQEHQHTCHSLDGGKTWADFSAQHPSGFSIGGSICFVSATEGYWLPANNGRAVRTADGGASWQYLDLVTAGGVHLPTSGESGWSWAPYFNKKNAVSSKEEPGVAYLYNYGPTGAEALRGVWRKEAGSTAFVQVFAGNMPGSGNGDYQYYMNLAEVPGKAGYLLLSSGSDQPNALLQRSKDRGVTWAGVTTKVGNNAPVMINAVSRYGFGVNLPGATVPAIRYYGTVGGVPGVYETLDDFVTSTLIETRPMNLTEAPGSITGDFKVFGTWYYGIGQQGWVKSTRPYTLTIS